MVLKRRKKATGFGAGGSARKVAKNSDASAVVDAAAEGDLASDDEARVRRGSWCEF